MDNSSHQEEQEPPHHRARPVRVDSQMSDNSDDHHHRPVPTWQMPDIRQKVAEDRNRSDKNDNYINNNCDNKFPDASQLRGQLFNGE